jgi:choline kinase
MTETAVILAAGRGSRLAPSGHSETYSKPLISIAGTTLLGRTIQSCRIAGARRIVVVTGFRADRVAAEAEALSRGDVEVVYNPRWKQSNGLSLLACRRHLDGPFGLMMSDHLFDPSILTDLLRLAIPPDSVTLAVDRKIGQVFDLEDATKVDIQGGRIAAIGKALAHYNAVDCGLFVCSPAIFSALAEVEAERGDCSLSEGMERVARGGGFWPFDIGRRWWQDVDTPEMLEAALAVVETARTRPAARVRAVAE